MSPKLEKLLKEFKQQTLKAIDHLEYSYKKVSKLSSNVNDLDLDQLESWESFTSRFARASDLFLSKYLRTLLQINDPAYKGSLIDSLNHAEKLNLIDNTETWYKIRELRNKEAHEYNEKTLSAFFLELHKITPTIIKIKEVLK